VMPASGRSLATVPAIDSPSRWSRERTHKTRHGHQAVDLPATWRSLKAWVGGPRCGTEIDGQAPAGVAAMGPGEVGPSPNKSHREHVPSTVALSPCRVSPGIGSYGSPI
jgi:hypothetical protein